MINYLPTVSIITAVYNGQKHIAETIESVLTQTHINWEMIILDDGSTDNTKEIVTAYLKDKRIKYFYQKNQKQIIARNNAFNLTQGEYIAILDADDIWMPTKLEKQLNLIRNDPSIGIVYTDIQKIDHDGTNIYTRSCKDITSNPIRYQIVSNNLAFSSFLIRKRAINSSLLDERFFGVGDQYLTIKLALDGWHFAFVDEKLLKYRVHKLGLSKSLFFSEIVFNEKLKLIDSISYQFKKDNYYNSILSIARAMAYLGRAVGYIKYGKKQSKKTARDNILKSLNYSLNWSILLRAIKWYILSFK